MKRNLLFAASCVLLAGSILTGCSKDDTTPPVITLTGASSINHVLNTAYTDAGATANDDEDGSIQVVTSGTVNKDLVGTYTITYTATDKAGNQSSATRSVRVYNEAEGFAGNYNVIDSIVGTTLVYPFTQTIRVDSTTNNRIRFNKFGDYANNTNIYAVRIGTKFEIPSQSAANIGSGSNPCNIADHTFQSDVATFTNLTSTNFRFQYTDAVTTSGCTGSVQVNSNWTKQ